MNLTELHRRLLAAARADAPPGDVPYGFTQRVMARVASRPVVSGTDSWAALLRPLWCGAAACAALALLLQFNLAPLPPDGGEDGAFSAAVEETLLAPAGDLELPW
ncbi:MAG: hypothetical protein RJA22_2433 [Verrucomicrobiota bacterium]|jgi:hypothetical protein